MKYQSYKHFLHCNEISDIGGDMLIDNLYKCKKVTFRKKNERHPNKSLEIDCY